VARRDPGGILALDGGTMTLPMLQPNGTRLSGGC